jgi:hypothetical protein
MNRSLPPILVCYDGSPAAARAIDAAGTLFPRRPAIVLYVSSRVAPERVRTTSVKTLREELIEEVRVAARRNASAVAEEGTRLARRAGLKGEAAGFEDRPSVPLSVPGRTPADREELIVSLRELRFTGPEIAETLGMPLSTVGAVLSRRGLGRLPRLQPDEPANSYERPRPGPARLRRPFSSP